MSDIMIDIETMGNHPTAPILALGAVKFNLEEGVTSIFYHQINLESCIKAGLTSDASTIIWWMQQSDAARAAFIKNEEADTLAGVLTVFSHWVGLEAHRIWGNGSDFDNVILSSAYRAVDRKQPWEFWNNRCYRTIKNQHLKIKLDRKGVAYNALDDVISQADHLIKILKATGRQLR